MMRVLPDQAGLDAAVAAIRADQVIAYPTETVYGLGVNPFSETALDALFAVKAREADKPVLLIVDMPAQIERYVARLSVPALQCMEKFWPGPLSLLLPVAATLPDRLTGPDGHICVRCPENATARQLCSLWGGPITSTSANFSGQPPARNAAAAALPGVSVVVDAGRCDALPPSTILNPDTGQILRAGPVDAAMLSQAGIASDDKH